MFSKIGRLFKKPQQTFGSKPELFASFMTYQFLERGWDLPKELIDECLEDAGPDFRSMIKGWISVLTALGCFGWPAYANSVGPSRKT